jgi:hypothetical protein
MLHDLRYSAAGNKAVFFEARLERGVIDSRRPRGRRGLKQTEKPTGNSENKSPPALAARES